MENNRRHKLQKANGMAHAWEWGEQTAVGIFLVVETLFSLFLKME